MSSPAPMLLFLRPLAPPKPSTLRHFLRLSTAPVCRAESRTATRPNEDRNLVASRRASPSYPPPSMKSQPRPKESKASRRTSFPTKDRPYPTRQPSHHQPAAQKLIPEPVEPLPAAECAPHLPYFVTRTRSNELPIYPLSKRGGNLKQTTVKKIDGQRTVLRDELRAMLGVEEKDAVINSVTGHIVLKGHHKPMIERYLRERLF